MNRIGSGVREAGGHLDGFGFQAIAPCDAETPAWDSAAEEADVGKPDEKKPKQFGRGVSGQRELPLLQEAA